MITTDISYSFLPQLKYGIDLGFSRETALKVN